MALFSRDLDEVWAYFESRDGERVPLPVELAGDICEDCRHLIPRTPALCCWWCTWDISSGEEAEYRQLIIEFEKRVTAASR